MLKENDNVTLTAVDLDYKGNGVCKCDSQVIFVAGLLKEETALVKIKEIKKNFGIGELKKIIKKSPFRREIDTLDSNLGSLDLVHLIDSKQLEWQEKTTIETFKKIAEMDIKTNGFICSAKTVYYRNKAVFHVLEKDILTLGLYNKEDTLERVDNFLLADPLINKFVKIINNARIHIEDELYHIVFRVNNKNQILITLVATLKEFDGLDALLRLLKPYDEVVGITINFKKNFKSILSDESIVVYKTNSIEMEIDDFSIVINDRSFFQINSSIINELYAKIGSYIKKDSTVIDAFCGVGSIGFYLAKHVKKIYMIDNNKENILMANNMKERNNFKNIEIIHGDVEQELSNMHADVLIVDPPRNGLHDETKTVIIENEYKTLIYLSCDAKTLARDINSLKDKFDIVSVIPIRMFPQTTSLETLVVLSLK